MEVHKSRCFRDPDEKKLTTVRVLHFLLVPRGINQWNDGNHSTIFEKSRLLMYMIAAWHPLTLNL